MAPKLRRLASVAVDPIGYAQSGPWPELVELGRRRLAADGVAAPAAVTVTSGTLDAIERLLTAHLRPGDRVGVEDPGWANLVDLVAALGLEIEPIPVDPEGPTVDGLRRAVRAGVSAVVVTSRAQNPTGGAVSATRAAALRRVVAAAPDVLVIEDDHAAELADVPLAPLAGAGAAWAFLRSVSKPYGPDLRVCVVAGDEASIARVEGRMRLGAGWVSTVLQRLVVQLWCDPAVDALIDRARVDYGRRRRALVTALADRGVTAHGHTGINVWVPVPDELSAVAALHERGWAVAAGALYRLASPPGLRITVSPLSLSDMDPLADAIVAAVASAGFAAAVALRRRRWVGLIRRLGAYHSLAWNSTSTSRSTPTFGRCAGSSWPARRCRHHASWEKAGIVDRDIWRKAGAAGLLGLDVDEEYGGGGQRDFRLNAVLVEEIIRAGCSGLGFGLHNDVVAPYLTDLTTTEQRERWLPGFCSGDIVTAIAMSEPGAGSDLAGIRTTAVRERRLVRPQWTEDVHHQR